MGTGLIACLTFMGLVTIASSQSDFLSTMFMMNLFNNQNRQQNNVPQQQYPAQRTAPGKSGQTPQAPPQGGSSRSNSRSVPGLLGLSLMSGNDQMMDFMCLTNLRMCGFGMLMAR